MKRIFFLLLLLAASASAEAAIVNQTLYLNRGTFTTVDAQSVPYLAFNATAVFNSRSAVVAIETGDQLEFTIINNDTAVHGFAVKGYFPGATIQPGDTFEIGFTFSNPAAILYYDHLDFPKNTYLGAAGLIAVEQAGANVDGTFFWNFREHQLDWNNQLAAGNSVNWSTYEPNYFTINGLSKPDLQNDSTAVIRGGVGETLHIFMVNPGLSCHPIHFHGYHVRILHSSRSSTQVNWEKDTLPLWPMEAFLVELVPDKPGLFPVHDHNLFSQTGGFIYNNGMFIMMEIN